MVPDKFWGEELGTEVDMFAEGLIELGDGEVDADVAVDVDVVVLLVL